jgi:DNA-binding NarL/FixJ family response regulator
MTQDTALTIMKTGANVFLTGEPGSGKTHTVNAYIRYLREHDINPSITASTGIAATHVGGMTIHSWSGIGIKRALSEQDLDEMGTRETLVRRVTHAKVLIIDEVSMLDGKILAMVELVCRTLRRSEEAFGGLQVILVGDFFQLPPIANREENTLPVFAFDSPAWARLDAVVCYISEQHRQDDATFLATLGAIRRGEVEDAVYECLSERRTEPSEHPADVPHLYTHNVDVDQKNTEALGKIAEDSETFYMTTKGKAGAIETLKRGCLSPEVLELKKDAAVMFTKNSFEVGYVNGTLGTVLEFDPDTGFPVIETREGERIIATPAEWAVEDGGKVLASITQIPLRLAWAITVHKSQGMSMDAAIMDLSRAFEYGQGYVALSRVRSLAGIHLMGINQRALEVHPLVLERDGAFRARSEEAEEAFTAMSQEQLATLHNNFLIAMGGKLQKKTTAQMEREQAKKGGGGPSTAEETLALVVEGKTLHEIAQERSRAEGTIVEHLEELAREGKLPAIDTEYFCGIPHEAATAIRAAIKSVGAEFLKPIFLELGERYPYEIIRLVRLEFGPPGKREVSKGVKAVVVPSPTSKEKPTNMGAKWSLAEEERLTALYKSGMKTKDIARELARLPGGIRARLKKLGLIVRG